MADLKCTLKFDLKHRVFDDEFKKMAVELFRLKGSVKEAADELSLDPSQLSK